MTRPTTRNALLVVASICAVLGLSLEQYWFFVGTMVALWCASWIRPN